MDETLAMARMAVADGTRGVICTPHWHPMIWPNEREGIAQAIADLRARLDMEKIPLEVWAGSELSLDAELEDRPARDPERRQLGAPGAAGHLSATGH
jgi:protein-tyrosine phosphatase